MILGDSTAEYPEYDNLDIEELKNIKKELESKIEVKDDKKVR